MIRHSGDVPPFLDQIAVDRVSGDLLLPALVAGLLVVVPSAWRLTRHVVTIAHEGAHGVAAVLSGRQLAGIRLHSDTSGLTLSRGRPTGPGMMVTAGAGYPGPALLGVVAAALSSQAGPVVALWTALVLLALLLLQIRNFHGLYVVALAGATVFAVTWWGSEEVQLFVARAGAWFLLIAAPRAVIELQRTRAQGRGRDSDADVLARLTRVPGLVWVGVFLLVTLACLVGGGALLLDLA
ncbi:M50 family metallopeptidase [Nocardioides pacificus]